MSISYDYDKINTNIGVSEASTLSVGTNVAVEGIVAGVAHEGLNNDSELILKDVSSDTLMAVRNIPYGKFPDFGYEKGDRIRFNATIKEDTSSSTCYTSKKYLEFSGNNGTIDTTIISSSNKITYEFDNVVNIDSWADMQSCFNKNLEPYTYLKMSAGSYYHPYTGTDTKNYRVHKNAQATAVADIKPDGSISVTIREDVMTANIGSGWGSILFDNEEIASYPGTIIDKEFYVVYISGNKSYYQLVILDESWMYDPEFKILGVSEDKKAAEINAPKAGTYSVMFVDYENMRFKSVNIVPVTVKENGLGRNTINKTDKTFTLGTGDKILLWDDIASMIPKCAEYVIE